MLFSPKRCEPLNIHPRLICRFLPLPFPVDPLRALAMRPRQYRACADSRITGRNHCCPTAVARGQNTVLVPHLPEFQHTASKCPHGPHDLVGKAPRATILHPVQNSQNRVYTATNTTYRSRILNTSPHTLPSRSFDAGLSR